MSGAEQPPNGSNAVSGPSKKANGLGKAFATLDLEGHNLPPSPAPSSPRNGRKYALATELVYTEGRDQYNASSTPIYQVSSEPSATTLRAKMEASGARAMLWRIRGG